MGGAADDLRNALELHPDAAVRFRAHLVLGDMALARDDFPHAAIEYGAALDIARVTQSPTPELHVRMAQGADAWPIALLNGKREGAPMYRCGTPPNKPTTLRGALRQIGQEACQPDTSKPNTWP